MYDNPIYQSFTANANAAVSTAADIFQIVGPKGKKGRLVAASFATSTATTTAASAINIGTQADADSLGSFTIPVTAINTAIQPTQAQLDAISEFAADTVYCVSGDGAANAGALDISITIAWY